MRVRYFALILGIFYIVVGLSGFLPPLLKALSINAPHLMVHSMSGKLFGIFPVNLIHTIVHLGVGIWGVVAYRGFLASLTFSKAVCVIFAILTIMGLVPLLKAGLGLVPLWGPDVLLHLVTAVLAGYFGFIAAEARTIEIRK